MSSKEEDKYFQEVERERRERLRRERELEAIRSVERQHIARELATTDDIAAEAMELGFDAETSRVLPLIPLIEVAWADGSVTIKEQSTVLDAAKNHGIDEGSPAYNFLGRLLNERPSALFFERTNRVLMHLIQAKPESWMKKDLPTLCREVAEASGGFLGLFGEKISPAEMAIINELSDRLDAVGKTAQTLSIYPTLPVADQGQDDAGDEDASTP